MPDTPDDSPHEKRKRGRPSTGHARSRATIQREYRQRQKNNVTKNTVETLDENMLLRKKLIEVMEELEAARVKVRVEYELGEKARIRVRQLEKQLAAQESDQSEATIIGE